MTNAVTFTEQDDLDTRKATLLTMLFEYDCEVVFTKVNGETRTMPCTLREAALPPQPVVEGKEPKKQNPEVISVWCLDKKEWRSFKTMNVISLTVLGDQG